MEEALDYAAQAIAHLKKLAILVRSQGAKVEHIHVRAFVPKDRHGDFIPLRHLTSADMAECILKICAKQDHLVLLLIGALP